MSCLNIYNALLGVIALLVSYIQNGHWLKVMEGMGRSHLVHDKKSVAGNCKHGTKLLGSSRCTRLSSSGRALLNTDFQNFHYTEEQSTQGEKYKTYHIIFPVLGHTFVSLVPLP